MSASPNSTVSPPSLSLPCAPISLVNGNTILSIALDKNLRGLLDYLFSFSHTHIQPSTNTLLSTFNIHPLPLLPHSCLGMANACHSQLSVNPESSEEFAITAKLPSSLTRRQPVSGFPASCPCLFTVCSQHFSQSHHFKS